jgi:membrane dipeptidase
MLSERGIAALTLAHLFPNDLAGHVEAIPSKLLKLGHFDTGVDLDKGLTEAGRAVVERMVELRMIPDVAHCTPRARAEIYEVVDNRIPIVATHVGMHSLNDQAYNLTESDISSIAASGGVAGVIFMPYWLKDPDPKVGLNAIWQTMQAIRAACDGSWEHVALGTDFDGFTDPPDDCYSSAELPKVRDLLDEKGLSSDEIQGVIGGNARRVLRNGWR